MHFQDMERHSTTLIPCAWVIISSGSDPSILKEEEHLEPAFYAQTKAVKISSINTEQGQYYHSLKHEQEKLYYIVNSQ